MSLKIVDIVKRFKGESGEDVEQWIERFETAVSITSAKDAAEREQEMANIIPLFLDGSAYRTWKQLSETEKKDMKAVKRALRRVYGISKAMAWQKIKTLRLFPGDSVDVIADEARTLFTIISETIPPDQLVSLAVIDSLPPEIAEQVRMQHGESMDLAKVVSCAKALLVSKDLAISAATTRQNWTRRQPRTLEPSANESSRRPGTATTVRCVGCQRVGHVQQFCYVICYRCGGRGHVQRNCTVTPIPGNGRAGMAIADHAIPASESRSVRSPSTDRNDRC